MVISKHRREGRKTKSGFGKGRGMREEMGITAKQEELRQCQHRTRKEFLERQIRLFGNLKRV